MPNAVKDDPTLDEELTRTFVDATHRTGVKVHASTATDPADGRRTIKLVAVDRTTGERIVAQGPDWRSATADLARQAGFELEE